MERKVTTVTTVLYNGNYDGPQMSISDISGCQMFVIARDDLNFISSHDEMKKPAFYVLIGSKKGLPTAYIGQTDDFSHRIKDHNNKKAFWSTVLVFMREGRPLTSNDVKYLEYLGYKAAIEAKTYSTDENKQNIKEPTVNPWETRSISLFFESCKFLADFRGYHVFTKAKSPKTVPDQGSDPVPLPPKLFTLQCKLTMAKGYIDGDGFVVVKGSRIDPSVTKWLTDKHKDDERNKLLNKNGTLVDGVWVLDQDVRFNSAYRAGVFCVAGSVNALKAWKDDEKRPLGDFIGDKEQS